MLIRTCVDCGRDFAASGEDRRCRKCEGSRGKTACPACGSTDFEGALIECPHCEGFKCSFCDMGDDVSCVGCDNEE